MDMRYNLKLRAYLLPEKHLVSQILNLIIIISTSQSRVVKFFLVYENFKDEEITQKKN